MRGGRKEEEEEKDGPLIRRGPIRPALLIGKMGLDRFRKNLF